MLLHGIELDLCRPGRNAISMAFDVPAAHAPMMESPELLATTFGVVDPRMAAEAVSRCFVHCVLKGMHGSPRIVQDKALHNSPHVLSAADVSCLIIPDGCLGLPTLAAMKQGIPVIVVKENRNIMRNDLGLLPFAPGKLICVENYLEAVGAMTALKGGVALASVRRPLAYTSICVEQSEPRLRLVATGVPSWPPTHESEQKAE